MIGRTGSLRSDPRVDAVLDLAQLLGRQALAVREVEAQLVGADVGAGLADVRRRGARAAPRAAGASRCGCLRRVARRAVDARRRRARPARSSPSLGLDHERLVVAGAHDVDDARAAVAVLALDRARVGDLAAALGVERRLGELDEQLRRRLRRSPRDRRALLERLVAGERASARPATLAEPRAGADAPARRRRRASARAAPPSARSKSPRSSKGTPRSAGELARELEREAVGVVQAEGVSAPETSPRAREQVVEQLRALLERAPEALLLGARPT